MPEMNKFGHPYEPYDEQLKLMNDLYKILSTKKVGIIESPTGTGKTLSLLCPSIAWLRDKSVRQLNEDLKKIEEEGGPTWLVNQTKQAKIDAFEQERITQTEVISRAKELAAQSTKIELPLKKKVKKEPPQASTGKRKNGDDITPFLLETEPSNSATDLVSNYEFELGIDEASRVEDKYEALQTDEKIVITSRTHSQLSQIADALTKIKITPPPRYVTLGSRKQLCIHPEVQKKTSLLAMNEACRDLQAQGKCAYRHESSRVRDKVIGEIMDIEDLATYGKQHSACPYYGAREAVPYAEVIGVPYPLLVVERTRGALNISLTNSVVIIDEAHNINDTVSSLNSCQLSESTVQRAIEGLTRYLSKLGPRLSFQNKKRVSQVIVLARSLEAFFKEYLPKHQMKLGTEINVLDLFARGNADLLDFNELSKFVYDSKLVYKVDSYIQSLGNGDEYSDGAGHVESSSLGSLVDFMLVATDPTAVGKIYLDAEPNGPKSQQKVLKYLLLDPSSAFENILNECQMLVLAGGTMEPTSDFTEFLVPSIPKQEIEIKSYDHIIPDSQILVMPLSDLKFTFANRSNPEVLNQLGHYFLEICSNIISGGIVAFFPGYSYLLEVIKFWKTSGLWSKLQSKKRMFFEVNTSKVDTFEEYSKAVKTNPQGAMLLAVVGGKLSEGINFTDELARAVIMVGLPFPNAFSAEMLAKRDFIERRSLENGATPMEAKENAKLFYENVAMKAVNQCVGRAIRHLHDYAVIYLIDERYKTKRVQDKLSKWIRNVISNDPDYVESTRRFFLCNRDVNKDA